MNFIKALALALCWLFMSSQATLAREALTPSDIRPISLSRLPPEARETLRLIEAGGPFPYRRDGIEFQNREKRLPLQSRGYYREYTVPTPGLTHRGARRIVTGKGAEYYYTADHYRSFKRITQP